MNYKTQEVHRYIKMEKLPYRSYHLSDFNMIIKLLYPYRETTNKYLSILAKTSFNTHQIQLIKQTAHNLTVINELYREQNKYGSLYVTREDVFNAIYMLQNELQLSRSDFLLSSPLRWFYTQLQQYFGGRIFTRKQVGKLLDKSKTTSNRCIGELVDRELIKIIGKKRNEYVYQLIEEETT